MDLNSKFEANHKSNIKKLQKAVNKLYKGTIDKIFLKAFAIQFKGETFRISDFPTLAKHIDEVLLAFSENLNILLVNGVKFEWDLSIDKNASIILDTYGVARVSDAVKKIIFDPQEKALEIFIKQKTKGLGLSDRVWNYTNQFRTEIEKGLYTGISDGTPAPEMARLQKQYLQQPDRLFRRVKNAKGNLVLSKAAKSYRPGRGIYRSSFKNALRLTRNVVNDAYRESDMVKYQTIPFVLGYEVKLADNHPRYDICDQLKGNYPKNFIWRKWHVNCICFCVSKLPSKKEYDKFEDAILNGSSDKFVFNDPIKKINPAVSDYLEKNAEMLNRLKRKPDWITQNKL